MNKRLANPSRGQRDARHQYHDGLNTPSTPELDQRIGAALADWPKDDPQNDERLIDSIMRRLEGDVPKS